MQLNINIDTRNATAKQLTSNLATWYEHQGIKRLTKGQFLDKLEALGYKLETELCENYHNTANKVPYLAKSIYIAQKDNGVSAYNVNARRDDNFKALQQLRQETFVFDNNRIWEL